jgi:hypothetical protein
LIIIGVLPSAPLVLKLTVYISTGTSFFFNTIPKGTNLSSPSEEDAGTVYIVL